MLTIGAPGFLAFLAYFVLAGLFWRTIAAWLTARNPQSNIAAAMLFVH